MSRRTTQLTFLTALLALVLFGVSSAWAAGGGAGVGETPPAPSANSGGSGTSGKARRPARRGPVLAGFALSNTALSDGSVMKLRYRVKAPASRVRVRGVVRTQGGRYVKTLELGVHRTNVLVTTALTASAVGVSRAGSYKLRLTARDGRNRAARRGRKVPAWRGFSFVDHRFPVDGPFSFGGDGARFGTGRAGHTHQGQDLPADSGTPVVAPFGGEISWVAYQAGGAGYYVVEHADDGRDYVFMHLLKDSTVVKQGQRVTTGQRIGQVGETGQAFGPHLHFEIWVGGAWQFGGRPVDPLSLLRSWLASGAGRAVRTSSAMAEPASGAGVVARPDAHD
jgi:murein DD-endopeptidase MepM/ murein hydrolase activator NlpD